MLRWLLIKEFRLQRPSLFFAAGVLMLWGVLMALTPQAGRVLIPHQLTMGELIDLLHLFFVSLCLQGIVPLLVGATLVAEERKQETWDWQLSLPVSRRLQWTVKLAVATAIVLTLTFAIQPLLDLIVSNILNGEVRLSLGGASHIVWTPSYFAKMNALYYGIPLALMVCAAFASTLTRFRQFRG